MPYQHAVIETKQPQRKTMKNNALNTEEPVRKSVCISIALAGFLCLAVSAQFMGSDSPRVQECAEANRTSNTQLTARDRFTRFKEKAASARREREIKNLIDQVEGNQPIAFTKKASGLQATQESNPHKIQ